MTDIGRDGEYLADDGTFDDMLSPEELWKLCPAVTILMSKHNISREIAAEMYKEKEDQGDKMIEKTEQINELALALSVAQGQMKSARKDAVNPFFNSRYATLDSIWDVCRKPLSDNGLSVVQLPSVEDGKLKLTQILAHSSGQYIMSELVMSLEKDTPHGVATAITYARRYLLGASVGITTDEDEDGNATSSSQQSPQKAKNGTSTKKPKPPTSPGELLAWLNKTESINGFYQQAELILPALGADEWPASDDAEEWKKLYIAAKKFAVGQVKIGATSFSQSDEMTDPETIAEEIPF